MAVEEVAKIRWRDKFSSGLKKAPLMGLLAAGAVTLPFIVSGFRNSRRYDEDSEPPLPKSLSDPLPPVMEYTPPSLQPAPTLMGQPLVEGDIARRVKLQRAGIAAAPDVIPPNITTPSGLSAIDGKHVRDLAAEPAKPSFGLPA